MDAIHTDSTPNGFPQVAAPSDPTPTPPESERLLAVRYWANVKDVTGTGAESLAWPELAPKLTTHTELQRKPDGTLWSPTLYRRNSNGEPLKREAVNVERVSCFVLDFDDGTPPAALEAQWQALGLTYAIHSSHRHAEALAKWRAIFPLTRDVAGAEWPGTYITLAAMLSDGTHDPRCKAASWFFYLPSCAPGAERFAWVQPGRFLDPEEFGTGSPVPTPAPAPVVSAPARLTGSRRGERSRTAMKDALILRALEKAPTEGRNNGGLWVGCQLRDNDFSPEETLAGMLEYRDRCSQSGDPYTVLAVHATHAQVFGRAPREPWSESQTLTLPARATGADPAAAPDPEQLTAAAAELENDIGNGKRFARFHAADVRHTPELGWLAWDGRRWRPDPVAVAEAAKATALRIFREVPHLAEAGNEDTAIRRGKWAKQSGDRNRLRGMLGCAETDPTIAARREDFDTDLWLLNCLNGTLDLRTGTLRTHRREDLLTRICPVAYDREARSEQWERFLAETTGGDLDLAEFLARAVGYSLTGSTREDALFFVHGPGGAGKSTFVEAVKAAMGQYAQGTNFETFLQRRETGGARDDIARMAGARFVVAIEVDEGKRLAEGLVKTLTGGDTVTARFLFKNEFEFRPEMKLWLVANHAPKVRDGDEALFRRLLRVPFEHFIPAESRDRLLREDLLNPALNGPAILAWAVRGCLDWQANGLRVPDVVTRATSEYRESQDLAARFLDDCCELTPDGWTASSALKTAFDAWARDNREKTLSAKALAARLQVHGLEPRRAGHKQTRGFGGVELLEVGSQGLFFGVEEPPQTDADGSEADSGKSLKEISHVGDFPESGVDPSASVCTPTAKDRVREAW